MNQGITTIKVKEKTRKNLQIAKQKGNFKNVDEVIDNALENKIKVRIENKDGTSYETMLTKKEIEKGVKSGRLIPIKKSKEGVKKK